MAMNTYI